MKFVNIQTSRLTLRRVRLKDAVAVHAYRSLPEVTGFFPGDHRTIKDTIAFLEPLVAVKPATPGTWLGLVITLTDTGRVIGDIGLRFPERKTYQVELGTSLDPAYQGKGYASEAMLAVMQYAFETLGKHRVYASIDPRNSASIALVERVGMRREAHFRSSIWWRNREWVDDLIYAMLETEWRERNK
ncbi:GNAT family N-acetyltransferase [candidate division GN15 bacterium]|uniref:GNAT family N-acetyltransferase n=1 Tax=candidate division GN15 bacterium TaxID=2072418 RepID=A0A855X9E0_9BACT|nr:MAG: GNAT family N-acetyltransferase [candidate division GN15 bacterium]